MLDKNVREREIERERERERSKRSIYRIHDFKT